MLSVLLWHKAAIKIQIPYFLVFYRAARLCMGCGFSKMLATEYELLFKRTLYTQENKSAYYSITIWVVHILYLDNPLDSELWQRYSRLFKLYIMANLKLCSGSGNSGNSFMLSTWNEKVEPVDPRKNPLQTKQNVICIQSFWSHLLFLLFRLVVLSFICKVAHSSSPCLTLPGFDLLL